MDADGCILGWLDEWMDGSPQLVGMVGIVGVYTPFNGQPRLSGGKITSPLRGRVEGGIKL